ncbi:MAG: peptidoglycan DD-metalloendopeptidase family protein [Alphaproteobacteria bacterium]|nr:peptidoglycan DD-metalloendopeptidase family protein [Alphaproteobacteria bacterium]
MKKFYAVLILLVAILAGCDLQPRIASIPDSIGDFITERYPTLLAEPDSEIYKTAVADYGVYASPTVYGDGDVTAEDYVLYSSADDYMMPAQDTHVDSADVGMPDIQDDDEPIPDTDVDDLKIPDYVHEKPVVEPKTKIEPKSQPKPKTESKTQVEPEILRAPLREITVERGDTLYSLSRKYSVPVNDLAVMNKISAPFALSVGQKIKVPDMLSVPQYNVPAPRPADIKTVQPKAESKKVEPKKSVIDNKEPVKTEPKKFENKKAEPVKDAVVNKNIPGASVKTESKPKAEIKKAEVKKTSVKEKGDAKKTDVKKVDTTKANTNKTNAKKTEVKPEPKKTAQKKTDTKKSVPAKPQRTVQKMVARSSSKFSWPVRGKILSGYGSKSNGLFNDGINIKAARGTNVVAAENGFVAYAGNEVKGMGNLIIVQHADGWMTVYAHMDSMSVRRGHSVSVGQKIGTVGTSGKVDQPQLHFEIRKGTRAYNPVNYLKK